MKYSNKEENRLWENINFIIRKIYITIDIIKLSLIVPTKYI